VFAGSSPKASPGADGCGKEVLLLRQGCTLERPQDQAAELIGWPEGGFCEGTGSVEVRSDTGDRMEVLPKLLKGHQNRSSRSQVLYCTVMEGRCRTVLYCNGGQDCAVLYCNGGQVQDCTVMEGRCRTVLYCNGGQVQDCTVL